MYPCTLSAAPPPLALPATLNKNPNQNMSELGHLPAWCREPPKAEETMKGAVKIGISTGALFYIAVATFGYLGLGNAVPDDILTAFDRPK